MAEPSPGSDEAIKRGCRCPVLDNGHGWGYLKEGVFVIAEPCRMHWMRAPWMPSQPPPERKEN